MNRQIGTATIKFTDAEIQLLINSLHMSITTVVPCVDSGQWKVPYESLRKDLKRILNELEDKKWKDRTNGTIQNPAECETCDQSSKK